LALLVGDSTNVLPRAQWSRLDRDVIGDEQFYNCIVGADTGASWSVQDGDIVVTYRSWNWDWATKTVLIRKRERRGQLEVEQPDGEATP
jgi:hypothetical protein